ncbi:MAG TPA: hypothetical protein VE944_02320 [Nostoc sp.]|uniref:hypothetical protein n=1 Tax=Nostoc sp. TaxID=1180 RepID=UPI002D73419A|nr:hypothetical protein [Nostoc sp.]HYX13202.1 hypothetical protein [Nostoc sp.]
MFNSPQLSNWKFQPICSLSGLKGVNLSRNSTSVSYLQPFNLVTFAYQGGLKQHGIPSGETLIFQTQNRNIIAKDLVKAAVNADKLPSQVLNDQNYLSAVNLQLNTLPD